jgi:hypothetical protein
MAESQRLAGKRKKEKERRKKKCSNGIQEKQKPK